MSEWSSGYVADIGYTFGYYAELNPARNSLPLLAAGLVPAEIGTACDLGFGQGLSINIHAAASSTRWFGTDFNPAQASFARSLAEASGSGVDLSDQSFAEFCARSDLPDFDYIGMHGIWSWISDDNRRLIVDFVRRKLRVGGILYISYNTQPGWAAMIPVRHLLTEHAEVMAAPGRGMVARIDAALEFADRLFAVNPAFARANPIILERFKQIKQQNRHYLAHEYFNRDWQPMPFAEMARWLEPAKLSYACSAHYIDHVDAANLTAEQQKFLAEVPDPVFRETVRDFLVNQQFRRDYWVRGARRLSVLDQSEALRKQRVMLITAREDVTLKAAGAPGEVNLAEAVYTPILDLLADLRPRSLAEIEQAVRAKGVSTAQVLQAMLMLIGKGNMTLVQDDKMRSKAKAQTDRLNLHLMNAARGSADVNFLASPVTGGGIAIGRFHQLFLLAKAQGRKTPEDWARFAWDILAAQGQRLVREGKTVESPEDNLALLREQAEQFFTKTLSVLKALQIA